MKIKYLLNLKITDRYFVVVNDYTQLVKTYIQIVFPI